ncbi:uncharacterized protein A1O9_00329, partial [Exophiala aquamarina CBS 119918]
MCRYTLSTCPYPDHDPIAALIFNPNKAETWHACDEPKPWGRLSCGNLSIEHPAYPTATAICLLPTRILAPRSNTIECGNEKRERSFIDVKPSSSRTPAIAANGDEVKPQSAQCLLCTTVLKLVSTKSKELQNTARQSLAELEEAMSNNAEVRKMQKAVMDKMMELETLRRETWKLTHTLLVKENDKLNTTGQDRG